MLEEEAATAAAPSTEPSAAPSANSSAPSPTQSLQFPLWAIIIVALAGTIFVGLTVLAIFKVKLFNNLKQSN